jgi:flagella basal body P-ring formation protein FlgA
MMGAALWAVGPETFDDSARSAIIDAVRSRIGRTAEVEIESLKLRVAVEPETGVTATPDPAGRLGRRMQFILFAPDDDGPEGRRRRIGYAEAVVRVTVEHAVAVQRIRGGTVVGPDDVVATTADVGTVPLVRLPSASEVVGARARRALEPGVPITARMLTIPPLVKSGQTVVTVARIGTIEARGRATAAQRGFLGDVIRLVNKDTGRRLRGRVIARGRVEVIYE